MIASSRPVLIIIGILVIVPLVSFSQISNYTRTNDGVIICPDAELLQNAKGIKLQVINDNVI